MGGILVRNGFSFFPETSCSVGFQLNDNYVKGGKYRKIELLARTMKC
jgi:hypothetical protein